MQNEDLRFMRRALEVARRGEGRVHPNPLVGAVLVKNGRVLSEGAHERFGGPHAEVNAFRRIKKIPSGTTLYLTLEPCDHFGKTPPCTEAILKSGVHKVVVAMKDPDPRVAGRGYKKLKKYGVFVKMGVLEKEARFMNRHYSHWIKNGTPYVTVKVGQSLDGKIATRTGQSRWITGDAARRRAHELRRQSDAVLVGVNTVLKDNPLLTVRLPGRPFQPLKVVLDALLKTPPRANLLSKKSPGSTLIFTAARAASRAKRYGDRAKVVVVSETKTGRLDWRAILRELGRRGVTSLLVEGGGEVIGSLFSEGRVQEVYFFTAPRVIGGLGAVGSVGGQGVSDLRGAASFKHWEAERVGNDLLFHGIL